MRILRSSQHRLLPLGISALINLVICAGLWHLLATTSSRERQFTVDLQAPRLTTTIPPASPRLIKLRQQAQTIIAREALQPASPLARRFEDLMTEPPRTDPTPHPAAPPAVPTQDPVVDMPPNPITPEAPATTPPATGQPDSPTGNGNTPDHDLQVAITEQGGRHEEPGSGNGPGEPVNPGQGAGPTAPANTGGGVTGGGRQPDTPALGSGTVPPANPDHTGNVTGAGNVAPATAPTSHGETRKGSVRTQTQPPYPRDAYDEGIQGTVELQVKITADGRVVELPRILHSSGSRSLDRAAQNSVRTWSFEPALSNGTPVDSVLTVHVRFELH